MKKLIVGLFALAMCFSSFSQTNEELLSGFYNSETASQIELKYGKLDRQSVTDIRNDNGMKSFCLNFDGDKQDKLKRLFVSTNLENNYNFFITEITAENLKLDENVTREDLTNNARVTIKNFYPLSGKVFSKSIINGVVSEQETELEENLVISGSASSRDWSLCFYKYFQSTMMQMNWAEHALCILTLQACLLGMSVSAALHCTF